MDFIKTSSLRALIELTFQRNWNGLIWMSRKGVIAKRVKTAPELYRESARRTGWPRNECSALGQNRFRPTEVSAKVHRPITSRPGKLSRGRPRHNATPRRARPCRASREKASRPRNPRVPRPMRRPSRETTSRVRPRNHRPIHSRPTADRSKHPATTVPTRPRPDCPADVPTDRPNAAVDPKPFLKPNPHNSSPKPAPT
ncbi:unnamed protein product [Microthlaspi erraticum]|uniref:Uncharacterized protein n=1 Tax=Microthlaspi erraticum TaxID=1685480 RepID=A0A6D2HJQ8_9BRAS|nr:unnamed protein product [Microthlaspi erraticum]